MWNLIYMEIQAGSKGNVPAIG